VAVTTTNQGPEDGLLSVPLSALEHVCYCPRQAALIHLEATWADNTDTVRGDLAHHAVDLPSLRHRRGVTAIRALPVFSRHHGVHGVCDLVEITGTRATPVEYKVGPYRPGGPADVQLAGQAACLAEAGFDVPEGYIYSAADRRRHLIPISDELLDQVRRAADAMRALLAAIALPVARHDRRCRRCSLREDCLPELTEQHSTMIDLFTPRPLGVWRD
jgi:CRISPR-associated exonuclease Cas4